MGVSYPPHHQPDSTGRLMSFSPNSPAAPASADARLTLLKAWLAPLNLVSPDSARPASSDASFRRYYRLDVLPGSANLPLAPYV